MLNYLGVLDNNFTLSQNKLSELLGTILNRNTQTVKEALIKDMKDAKTSDNLDFVVSEFQKYGLSVEKVLADSSTLKEKN